MSLHMMIPLSLEGIILLCAVSLCCCGSELVRAESESGMQNITLFDKGTTQPSGAEEGEVYFFTGQSFIEVNGMLMAIANAHYQPGSNDKVGDGPTDDSVWVKYFRYKGTGSAEWVSKITEADGSGWKMELAVARKDVKLCNSMLHGPQVVVRDERIFMLLLRENKPKEEEEGKQDCGDDWDLELYVGNVSQTTTETNVISWGSPISLKSTFTEQLQKKSWTTLAARNGRGVLMDGSTIVFPLVGLHNNEEYSGDCTVVYSKDGGSSWKFPTQGAIAEGCESQRPFVWEGKLYMIVKHEYLNYTAHQSSDGGETWARVSGNQPTVLSDSIVNVIGEARDIIAASIAERNVILFTMPQGYLTPSGSSDVFHLWMTDTHRVHPVGPISHDPAVWTSFVSLLYTNDELFSLHDLGEVADGRVVLTHLAEQLDQIKSVLKTWKDVDGRISPPSLTNGLVGFLSNKGDTAKWEDEFLGVDAMVQGSATKVDNGLNITLPGTQVVWPIGEQGDNQAYSFTDRGFTVVATVTIHNKPQSVTRLMGVGLIDLNDGSEKEHIWLLYNKDKQWKGVIADEGSGEPNTWEEGKTYQVALIFEDGTGSAYIDGKRLGSLEDPVEPAAPNAKNVPLQARAGECIMPRDILRVYFGEQNGSNQGCTSSEVTVRNVMLYTRPLDTAELEMPISINTNSSNIGDGMTNSCSNSDGMTNSGDIGDAETKSGNIGDGETKSGNIGDAKTKSGNIGDAETKSGNIGDAETKSGNIGDAKTKSGNIGDAETKSGNIGDAKTKSGKNSDALKTIKGDSSMYQRVSCLLLVFMGFLGFVSLF